VIAANGRSGGGEYFGKHDAVAQVREPIDEVNQIEERLVFTRSSLVFGNDDSVNDDDDAIATRFDGRGAIGELRWNGVAVCLVDHFGKSRYTHVRETAGRRMKRRIHHAFSPEDRLRERIR